MNFFHNQVAKMITWRLTPVGRKRGERMGSLIELKSAATKPVPQDGIYTLKDLESGEYTDTYSIIYSSAEEIIKTVQDLVGGALAMLNTLTCKRLSSNKITLYIESIEQLLLDASVNASRLCIVKFTKVDDLMGLSLSDIDSD